MRNWLVLSAALVVLAACSGEKSGPVAVALSETAHTFPAEGGSWLLGVDASGPWTVSSDASWLTVDETSGDGPLSLVVRAAVNGGSERTGRLTFTSGKTFTATQHAASTPPDPGPGTDPVFTASVSTLPATSVTLSSAVLHGSYTGLSTDVAPQGIVFRWGTSASGLTQELAVAEEVRDASGTVSAVLDGLSNGRTYYFQLAMDAWNPETRRYETVAGSVLSFTTTAASSPSGSPDWPELPALNYTHHTGGYNYYTDNNDPALYFTHHWTDEKTAASGAAYQRNYTCCWNSTYKCPVWVAAPRHGWYEGSTGRQGYSFNPDMPREVQYNATSGSGAYNRGHMLGSAERTRSASINRQVFYVTNIAPQHGTYFNTGGGGWNILEDWVDKQVCSDTLYVVIGCYFDTFTDGYGNTARPSKITSFNFMGTPDVQCPTMMYYLLLRTKSGSSGKHVKDCTASELQCAAFVRAQAPDIKGQKVTAKEMMSVSDLERITGFTYFPNVPNAPKATANASDWGL